jgi:hypothetical protein
MIPCKIHTTAEHSQTMLVTQEYGIDSAIQCEMSQDSSVSTVMSYELDAQGSIPRGGQEIFLLHSIQKSPGIHPACSPMCTKISFPGGKGARA